MHSISVSDLDTYRWWREQEDLDLAWLLKRFRREEPQTEAMKAGEALHKWLESPYTCETIFTGDYRFDVNCEIAIQYPKAMELSIQQRYGDLLVRGRIDASAGHTITDYKTTERFEPDRLLEGFQWRYYLDMTGCSKFIWQVFVMKEFGADQLRDTQHCYTIYDTHKLVQVRYPGMHEECLMLAEDFLDFAKRIGLKETSNGDKTHQDAGTDSAVTTLPGKDGRV